MKELFEHEGDGGRKRAQETEEGRRKGILIGWTRDEEEVCTKVDYLSSSWKGNQVTAKNNKNSF
jgi:hypothetical protein